MSSIDTTNNIIKTWVERAKTETDPFNIFISYWIAFNAWYGKKYSENDRACIDKIKEQVKNQFLKLTLESSFISELDNLNLINILKRKPVPVKENQDVIEWVYIARNNLFHGNKADSEPRDLEIVKKLTK